MESFTRMVTPELDMLISSMTPVRSAVWGVADSMVSPAAVSRPASRPEDEL